MPGSGKALADQPLVMAYLARFKREPEGTTISFPDFPTAQVSPVSGPNVFEEARNALRSIVCDLISRRSPIPASSRRSAQRKHGDNADQFEAMVPLDHVTAMKAILVDALARRGMTNVELAKHLDCDEREVRRLVDPNIESRTRLIDALEAVGAQIAITIIDTSRPVRVLRAPHQSGSAEFTPEPVIATAGPLPDEES